MSLKMAHWVWSLTMPRTPKMVMLALAYEADDEGLCFPSVPYVAQRCSCDERTVQRVLRRLTHDQYVSVEHRSRQNGASTTNGYRLRFGHPPANDHPPAQGHPPPGNMPPGDPRQDATVPPAVAPPSGVAAAPGGGWQQCHREGGNAAGGTTTTKYVCIKPVQIPLPRAREGRVLALGDRDRGGDLCFPEGTSSTQQEALGKQLAGLGQEDAQQILDELAGRMNASQIRDPVRYCAGLVERFRRGAFRLESGRAVAQRREFERQDKATPAAQPGATETPGDRTHRRMPVHIRDELERYRRAPKSDQGDADPDAFRPQLGSAASTLD